MYNPAQAIIGKGKLCESIHIVLQGEVIVSNIPPPLRTLTATEKAHGKLSFKPESINRRLVSNVASISKGSLFGVEEVLKISEEEIQKKMKNPMRKMQIRERHWRSKSYIPYKNGLVAGSCSVVIMEIDQTLFIGHCSLDTFVGAREEHITRIIWRRQQSMNNTSTRNTVSLENQIKKTSNIRDEVTVLDEEILSAHNTSLGNHAFGNYLDMLTSSLVRTGNGLFNLKKFQDESSIISSNDNNDVKNKFKQQTNTKLDKSMLKRTASITNLSMHPINPKKQQLKNKKARRRYNHKNRKHVSSKNQRHHKKEQILGIQTIQSPRINYIKSLLSTPKQNNMKGNMSRKERHNNVRLPSLLLTGSFESNNSKTDLLRRVDDEARKLQNIKDSSFLVKPETPFVIEYFKL